MGGSARGGLQKLLTLLAGSQILAQLLSSSTCESVRAVLRREVSATGQVGCTEGEVLVVSDATPAKSRLRDKTYAGSPE